MGAYRRDAHDVGARPEAWEEAIPRQYLNKGTLKVPGPKETWQIGDARRAYVRTGMNKWIGESGAPYG